MLLKVRIAHNNKNNHKTVVKQFNKEEKVNQN